MAVVIDASPALRNKKKKKRIIHFTRVAAWFAATGYRRCDAGIGAIINIFHTPFRNHASRCS